MFRGSIPPGVTPTYPGNFPIPPPPGALPPGSRGPLALPPGRSIPPTGPIEMGPRYPPVSEPFGGYRPLRPTQIGLQVPGVDYFPRGSGYRPPTGPGPVLRGPGGYVPFGDPRFQLHPGGPQAVFPQGGGGDVEAIFDTARRVLGSIFGVGSANILQQGG